MSRFSDRATIPTPDDPTSKNTRRQPYRTKYHLTKQVSFKKERDMRPAMLTTTLIGLSVTTAASAREEPGPLPDAKLVKTVSIKFDHPKHDDIEFTATPEDWKAIRAGLLPARRDPKPADWEWVATLKIVKKDGQPFRVEVYATNKDPGAFAAGRTYKQRVYYRGGKTAAVVKAINAAYEKSRQKDE